MQLHKRIQEHFLTEASFKRLRWQELAIQDACQTMIKQKDIVRNLNLI